VGRCTLEGALWVHKHACNPHSRPMHAWNLTHRSPSCASRTCLGSLSSAVASASFTALHMFNCLVSPEAWRSCWGPNGDRSEKEVEESSGSAMAAWDNGDEEHEEEHEEEETRCQASPTARRIAATLVALSQEKNTRAQGGTG
jgi:hypothetical protein